MGKNRDHNRYELRDKHKLVYVGITDNPARREAEHKNEGKRFTSMNVVGPKVTKASAERWEEERLATYGKNHRGRTPRHNKTER